MKIDLKCICGAEFHMDDHRRFRDPLVVFNEKGPMFVVQAQAAAWLSLHIDCVSDRRNVYGLKGE
jgi:hypothetical protein